MLKEYLEAKNSSTISTEVLRSKSSSIITPEDIDEADKLLLNKVRLLRKERHIVIDSHAVTYEKYGLRATPFKQVILYELNFNMLISLYSDVKNITQRIETDPHGRPQIDSEEISIAVNLQNSLVMNYGILFK